MSSSHICPKVPPLSARQSFQESFAGSTVQFQKDSQQGAEEGDDNGDGHDGGEAAVVAQAKGTVDRVEADDFSADGLDDAQDLPVQARAICAEEAEGADNLDEHDEARRATTTDQSARRPGSCGVVAHGRHPRRRTHVHACVRQGTWRKLMSCRTRTVRSDWLSRRWEKKMR